MPEYRTVLESTNISVMVFEEDATISLVNPQFERITGYSKAEVEGKRRWTEFFIEDELRKIKQYCRQCAADPERGPSNCETELIAKNGAKRNILLTIATVPGTRESVASFLDITRWKLTGKGFTFGQHDENGTEHICQDGADSTTSGDEHQRTENGCLVCRNHTTEESEMQHGLAKLGKDMTTKADLFQERKSGYLRRAIIETTLYDLIGAISEDIEPGEDHLLAQTVRHLIDTGRLKFINGR